MLGKSVTNLQSNISVGDNAITGTLKHVTGYTGFSGKAEEQSGNYLAFHCEAEGADSITVELIGGLSGRGEVTLDGDGLVILRISNTAQQVRLKAYKNGNAGLIKTYSLTGLTLQSA